MQATLHSRHPSGGDSPLSKNIHKKAFEAAAAVTQAEKKNLIVFIKREERGPSEIEFFFREIRHADKTTFLSENAADIEQFSQRGQRVKIVENDDAGM